MKASGRIDCLWKRVTHIYSAIDLTSGRSAFPVVVSMAILIMHSAIERAKGIENLDDVSPNQLNLYTILLARLRTYITTYSD